MSESAKFAEWHSLLTEAMPHLNVDYQYSRALYQTAAVCWGMGQTYQSTWPPVNLTKLYEQAIMLATLKGTHNEQ